MIYYRGAPCADTTFPGMADFFSPREGPRHSKHGGRTKKEHYGVVIHYFSIVVVFLVWKGPLGISVYERQIYPLLSPIRVH